MFDWWIIYFIPTALLQMGRCLVDQRRSLEAKTYLQQALKINKKTLGSTHRHTADSQLESTILFCINKLMSLSRLALYALGICLGDLGLWESGLKHLDEALSVRKAAYGEVHINVGWGRSALQEQLTSNSCAFCFSSVLVWFVPQTMLPL